jgi:WD40 repeat protein
MRAHFSSLLALLVLLIAGAALAQDRGQIWFGINAQDVTREEADKLGWEAARGVKVLRTIEGSPAAAAGLEPGDVIAMLDGVEVKDGRDLHAGLLAKGSGAVVKLRVLRAGREKTVSVTLGTTPPPDPVTHADALQLMLDTGGHSTIVRGLAVTPDGKQIVSASQDKTIRVWDIETGKTVRVIRGEIAPGDWGTIYALALSPDGRQLAIGGYLHGLDNSIASAIRLYDFATGKMTALLKGHDNVVDALAFSPDGRRLISGGADNTAIVWDMTKLRQTIRLSGHAKRIKAVAFTSDGERAVTGSEDESLRLWSLPDGKLIAEMTEHKAAAMRQAIKHDAEPNRDDNKKSDPWHAGVVSLAASPMEQLVASGSADGRVLLWDAGTGAFVRELLWIGGMKGAANIYSVSFSPDGRWLLSTSVEGGCLLTEVATGRSLYDGDVHDKKRSFFDSGHIDCRGKTAFSRDGRLAVASNNNAIRVLDPRTGSVGKTLQGSGRTVWGVGFAPDGSSIAWTDARDKEPKQAVDGTFKHKLTRRMRLPRDGKPLGGSEEIAAGTAAGDPRGAGDDGYTRGNRKHGALSVGFRRPQPFLIDPRVLEVTKEGKLQTEIKLEREAGFNDDHMTFAPDGQSILIGLTPGIQAYDVSGRFLGDFVGHDGQVRDLAPSPDGRLLLSGGSDQTVRLWNLKTRELIVTLFHGSDGEWVMWTPQGYYTGSPGADKIVGWQANKGPESTAEYVGAEQLRQHLNRPDIVEKAILLASAKQAVREAPGTSFKITDLLARPVPRFAIVSPPAGSVERRGRSIVKIALEEIPDPVRLIRVQVNGRQVAEETPHTGSGGLAAGERILIVPLAKGSNEIRVTLTNAMGERAETLTLTHEGEGDLDRRGTLHILAIGVNDYKGLGNLCGNSGCDLRAPGADARTFAEAVEKRLGPDHLRIVKRVLVNGGDAKDAPTASNIIDAVELLRQARETDTVVLFVAGHGVNEGPSYRFLPTDAAWMDGALRGSTVVPWQVLQEAVEAAKGRRLLFVDTCHSGNAYNQRLGNAAYHANIIAYTSARFDQEALEDPVLGHGLFTYAVVEGLEGKGAMASKNQLSTKDLAEYVVGRVGALARAMRAEQEPQYFKGRDAQDYVLVRR